MSKDRKIILTLAVPAVLQTVVRSLFIIVDAYWVGKMGSAQLAALTVATFLVWGILALGETIAVGTNSLVAQTIGAKDFGMSKKISLYNVVNTFIYSQALGFVLIPVLPLFYFIINLAPGQSLLVSEYLITLLLGLPCIILLSTITAVFRGYGDTKTPFYLLVFAIALNFVLAPMFIFGFKFIPALGIKGAALSTLVSYFAGFIIGYIILRRREMIDFLSKYKPDIKIIKETLKIGLPIALNGVGFSLIYVFVSRFVSDYGTTGFAALGIGHRSESLAYQMSVGFSLSTAILVGHNIGAGKPDRAETLAWKSLGLCSLVMLVYSVLLFIFSREIAQIFTTDSSVIEAASNYNKIAAFVLVFSAAEVVLSGAFSGAGDTLPTFLFGFPLNFLRIPLSPLFAMWFGLTGIWFAICLTVIIKGVAIAFWFRRGKWKTKKSILIKTPITSDIYGDI